MPIQFSPLILAILAGAWNVEHTLAQGYGITRIYGRLVGQQQGGSELPMLFAWVALGPSGQLVTRIPWNGLPRLAYAAPIFSVVDGEKPESRHHLGKKSPP